MKIWRGIKKLFLLSFFFNTAESSALLHNFKEDLLKSSEENPFATRENIRFDNTMRVWITAMSFAACLVLWMGGMVRSLAPVLGLLFSYGTLEVSASWLLLKTPFHREINYSLCSFDLAAISLVVYWTGGTSSPFYFLYFVPLIIQAFHRDWSLLLFYGLGGVVSYTVVMMSLYNSWSSSNAIDLGTRLFLMLLTVGVSLLAVSLLIRGESVHKRQLSRVKFLTYASQRLNAVAVLNELPSLAQEFAELLNIELKEKKTWSRLFLVNPGSPVMQAIEDPSQEKPELKKSLAYNSCPVIKNNTVFEVKDSQVDQSCPTESFEFGSHLCVPISGTQNESFGVIFSGSTQPNTFGEEEKTFLGFIGKSIGLTIQRLKKNDELRHAFEMDSFAMACFMESFRSPESTFDSILDGFNKILGVDQSSLLIWDPEMGALKPAKVVGLAPLKMSPTLYRMGEGIFGKVLESRQAYWTYDQPTETGSAATSNPYKSLLSIPLQSIKGEPLGVVNAICTQTKKLFTVEEIEIASTFASRAAVALENAQLHKKSRFDLLVLEEGTAEEKAA